MNWIDALLVLVLLLSVLSGWQRGFIFCSLNLFTWVGSILVGFWAYPYLSVILEKYFPSIGGWTAPLAFILIILFTRVVLGWIRDAIFKETSYETHQNPVNKFLGVIPGFINGLVNATIISLLLLTVPFSNKITAEAQQSKLTAQLTPPAEWLEGKLAPVFDKAVSETLTRLTVEPGSDETINLPYTVTNAKVRLDLEAKMLDMLNKERSKRGLKLLKADPELTNVARAHSRDMFARGYFSHYTPEGKDPFDRMRDADIRFLTAGENLALAKTLNIAHTGLMNSPGHRANILNAGFGRVGIGIIDGGIYGLMISQEFRN